MKKRFIALVLALSTIMSIFVSPSVVRAEIVTVKDDRTPLNKLLQDAKRKIGSDDFVTVLKSAEWTDEEKGEAEIKIEVQSKEIKETTQTQTESEIKNSDVIFIVDRSFSIGAGLKLISGRSKTGDDDYDKWITAKNIHQATINNIVKPAIQSLIEDNTSSSYNRIAYADFASALFTYKTGNTYGTGDRPYNYGDKHYGLDYSGYYSSKNFYKYIVPKNESSYATRTGEKWKSSWGATYAYDRFKAIANYQGALKFYTDPTQISNMLQHSINFSFRRTKDGKAGAREYGFESGGKDSYGFNTYGGNTNFDLPLMWAKGLLEKRGNTDRKAYVIFITDGDPYPLGGANESGIAMSADNVANRFYADVAKDIRDTYGAEIYSIIVDSGAITYNKHWNIWSQITGDNISNNMGKTKSPFSYEYQWRRTRSVPANSNYLATDTKHIKVVENNQTGGKSATATLNNIIDQIKEDIIQSSAEGSVETSPIAFTATLTDVINTEHFQYVSHSCNVSNQKIEYKNGVITWTFSGLNYGEKVTVGGKQEWPTITIKIKTSDYGSLPTNKQPDPQCEVKHPEKPEEPIKVPSPVLERRRDSYSVNIKYIDDDATGSNNLIAERNFEDKLKGTTFPSSSETASKLSDYGLDGDKLEKTFGAKAKGYDLKTDKVKVNGKQYTIATMPTSLTMDANKTIEFYYARQQAEVKIRSFKIKKVDGKIDGSITQDGATITKQVNATREQTEAYPQNIPLGEKYGYIFRVNQKDFAVKPSLVESSERKQGDQVKYTLAKGDKAYIDFLYLKEYYTVEVRYQDENGNPIKSPVKVEVEKGKTYNPDVPDTIDNYDFERRDDGQPQHSPIGPVNEPKVLIVVYKSRGHKVKVRYMDIDDQIDIADPYETPELIPVGQPFTPNVPHIIRKGNINYQFIKRSDGKGQNESIIMGNEDIEIICWYQRPKITPKLISPVDIPISTSAPEISGKDNIIILDEFFGLNRVIDNFDAADVQSTVRISFPFDVYYNNEFIKANTEFIVETKDNNMQPDKTYDFRLPSWIKEQSYDRKTVMRLVAPDGVTEYSKGTVNIIVVGKIYDFTVTALTGDTMWSTSMFNGARKEYKADTLPIGQNKATSNVSSLPIGTEMAQQQAKYNYGIKLGSTFLFSVNTKGLKSDSLKITPMLEYYSKDGTRVNDVSFKYSVQGKGEQDFASKDGVIETYSKTQNNFTTMLNKTPRTTAEVVKEIQKAMQLQKLGDINLASVGEYADVKNAYTNVNTTTNRVFGNFGTLTIPNTLRLPYANYSQSDLTKAEAHRIGNTFSNNDYTKMNVLSRNLNYVVSNISEYASKTSAVGLNDNAIVNSLGHWYAEYKLPSTLTVKSSDGKTISDGYIVVRFRIESLDKGGKDYLLYTANQWATENAAINRNAMTMNMPIVRNTDGTSKQITISNLNNGYYPVAIYEAGQSINNDYETSGTY